MPKGLYKQKTESQYVVVSSSLKKRVLHFQKNMWVAFVSAKLSPSQCKGVVGGCQGIAMRLLRCGFSRFSMLLCGCYGNCLMVKSRKSFTLVPKYDSSSSREFYIFWSGVFFLQNSPSQCKLVVGCCWGVAKVFSYTDCLEVKVKRA